MDSIKKILIVVLICIFEISAMAKESNAYDKSLDFSITLKALNKLILEEGSRRKSGASDKSTAWATKLGFETTLHPA